MAEEKNYEKRTTGKTLDDLYRVVKSIDRRVEEVREEIGDFVRMRDDTFDSFYDPAEFYHEHSEC